MPKCMLFNIEMPIGEQCPSSFRQDGMIRNDAMCYADCTFAENDDTD